MRKQDKLIVWPAYFDANKTREKGRRVSKNMSVQSPKIEEIESVVQRLGLKYELAPLKGYPKTPWAKPGMIMVQKKESKERIMKRIASELLKVRSES
jgi:signal recognition particle subunit SRP19